MSTAIANQLYLAYLGRPADTAWRAATAAAIDPNVGPSAALQSAFYNASVVDGVFSLTDSSSSLVNKIFLNIFGFAASTFEQNAWATLIDQGAITAPTAAWTIFVSYLGATNVPAAYQQPTQSKLIAMEAFTAQLANDSAANVALTSLGSAAATSARSFITGVTSQATGASAIAGIVSTVANVGTAVNGTTFALTTSVDSLTGTLNNDAFTATNTTFSAGDSLNGGLGVDRLTVTASSSLDTTSPAVTLTSVETVNFISSSTNLSTSASGINAAAWSGLLTLGLQGTGTPFADSNTSGGAYFSNLQANAGLSLSTITVIGANSNAIRVDFAAGKIASATANLSLTLSGGVGASGTRADIAVETAGTDAFTTVSVANSGTSFIGLEKVSGSLSPTAITITGTGSLDLAASTNASFANLATVTASSASTAVTLNLTGVTKAFTYAGGSGATTLLLGNVTNSITTGDAADAITAGTGVDTVTTAAGNDTFTTAIANLTSADVIDLGAGTRDAVMFTNVATLNSTGVSSDALSALNAVKNFEVVGSSAAVTAVDLGYFTQTVYRLSGNLTANVTATNASSDTIELTGAGITGVTGGAALNIAGAASGSTISLELNGVSGVAITANNTAATNTALTLGSTISTVNILSSGIGANTIGAAGATVTTVIDNPSANSFVLTGAQDLSIGAGGANSGGLTAAASGGFTTAMTFDASAFTGKLTINASVSADTIKGGTGSDTIRGLGGNDTIDLTSGGSDTVTFSASASLNGRDTISGFAAGASQDVLNVGSFITTPGTLTTVASLTGAITLATNTISVVNVATTISGKAYGAGDFGDLFAAAGKVFSDTVAASAKGVLVIQGTDQSQVLFVDASLNGANTNVQAGDVVVVGVLSGLSNASTFVIGNFA